MRYAVIGAGAIGGYYGGMLARGGADVHFLMHSDYEEAMANGLTIESGGETFNIGINAYGSAEDMPRADVALVGLKTLKNHLLPELLRPIVREGTAIVLIQNGIGYEEEVQRAFPEAVVCGGLAFICAEKTGAARVSHYDYGEVTIGSLRREGDEVARRIAEDFARSGVEAKSTGDLLTARWKKLVWNCGFNGQSVVFGKNTAELLRGEREWVVGAMEEIVEAGRRNGAEIEESFIGEMIEFTERMKPYYPSMSVDYRHGRGMEIEAIYGRPIRMGEERGVGMETLKIIEERLIEM